MPFSRRCAHCGSLTTQATVDEIQCLVCGKLTDNQGRAIPSAVQYGKEPDGQDS